MRRHSAILLLFILLHSTGTHASDLAREQRLHDQIIDAIMDGEPVMLNASGHAFLAIHTQTDPKAKKGVAIILHGRGMHPEWGQVVQPLRIGLPEHGWDTLALQMPVLDKTAKYYDYVPIFAEAYPRLESATQYLRKRGYQHIVLIAHSCGAHMAMNWIDKVGDSSIDAYVGIGMGATDYKQPMHKPFPLAQMKIPVLDIYGSNDYPAVLKMAPNRLAMLKQAGNPQSAQRIIKGADHYQNNHGEVLLKTVADWLGRLNFPHK